MSIFIYKEIFQPFFFECSFLLNVNIFEEYEYTAVDCDETSYQHAHPEDSISRMQVLKILISTNKI